MMRFFGGLIIVIALTSLSVQSVVACQEEVDWIWKNVKAKTRGGSQCKNFVVKAGPLSGVFIIAVWG